MISARWIPKLLSAVEKEWRVECVRDFLERCGDNREAVIRRIVTEDETLVLYFDPTTKRRRPNDPGPLKAKVQKSWRKAMATVFWDCEGILLVDFKEEGTTVNGSYYASLIIKLRGTIKKGSRKYPIPLQSIQ